MCAGSPAHRAGALLRERLRITQARHLRLILRLILRLVLRLILLLRLGLRPIRSVAGNIVLLRDAAPLGHDHLGEPIAEADARATSRKLRHFARFGFDPLHIPWNAGPHANHFPRFIQTLGRRICCVKRTHRHNRWRVSLIPH